MQLVRIGRKELLAKASSYLERARLIAPERIDVRERSLMVALVTGQRDQARQSALFLFRKRKELDDPYGAEQVFQAYLKVFPDSFEILDELWKLHGEMGEPERGISFVFDMVSAAETEVALDRAERLLKRLLEWDPQNAEAQQRLLGIHERQGRQEKVAQESLKLAASLLQQGKPEAALTLYGKVVDSCGQDRSLLQQVAEAYAELGEKGSAYQLYLRLGKTDSEDPEERSRAIACLEKARSLRPALEEPYHLMAQLLLADGNRERAAAVYGDLCRLAQDHNDHQKLRKALDRLLEIAPEDNEAAKQQISLLFSVGEVEEGVQILRKRLASARSTGDWESFRDLIVDAVELRAEDMELWGFLLEAHNDEVSRSEAEALVTRRATLFRLEGTPQSAAELAGLAIRSEVESVRLRELLAAAREDVGDLQGALAEYRSLAECLHKEGAEDQAFATLERCLTLAEDRRPVLEELITLAAEVGDADQRSRWEKRLINDLSESGRTEDLLQWLQDRVAHDPQRLDLSRRLVEEAIATTSSEEAGESIVAHLERVEQVAPDRMGEEIDYLLSRFDTPVLVEWCINWADRTGKREKELELLLRMVQGAEEAGDLEQAREVMERVLQIAPDSLNAREIQIRLLNSLGEEAELEAALLSYARLLVEKDRANQAVPVYRQLLSLSESAEEVLFELVDLLAAAVNKEEATAECMRWISGTAERGDVDGTVRVYEKARSVDPANTHLIHELSRYLERVGKAKEAAAKYQELGEIYLDRELPDRAIECFRRAKYLVPDDPRLIGRLVDLFEKEGMLRAAVRELEALAELHNKHRDRRNEKRVNQRLAKIRMKLAPAADEGAEPPSEVEAPKEAAAAPAEEESAGFDAEEVRALLESGSAEAEATLGELLSHERTARDLCVLAEIHEEAGRREDAGQLFEKAGRKASEVGDLEAACRYLSAALLIRQDDLDLASDLAELEAERGNRPGALELFQQVAERAQRKQEYDRSADTYRKMLDLGCQNLAVRTGLAWSLAKAGRGEEACREFIQYGRMLEEKGLPEEAISAYRKAVSLFPQNKEAREYLVRLFEDSGRSEDAVREKVELAHTLCAVDQSEAALEILQEVLEEDPKALKAREALITVYSSTHRYPEELRERKALADIYLEKGERRKAITQYEEMLELGEQDPKVYLILAEEYRRSGDRLRARELFVALADHYSEQGMWSKCVSCLLQVLQMDPDDLEMRRRIAEAYYHDGMRDKAVGEYLRIAQEYLRQDHTDLAIAQYERVREMDPRNVRILGKIADCYAEQQDSIRAVPVFLEMIDVYRERGILGKAIEVAKAAVQRFPKEPRLQEALAEICIQRGMSSEALSMYRQLAEMHPDEVRYRGRILRLERELGIRKTGKIQTQPPKVSVPVAEPPPPSQPQQETGRSFSRSASRHTGHASVQEAERSFRLGNYARCLDLCRQIIPTCSPVTHLDVMLQTYALSARCHLKAGEAKEAIKVLMQALTVGGISRERAVELRYLLGNALEADGQREQAAAVYKKVMEVDPNYADIRSKLIWARAGTQAGSKP